MTATIEKIVSLLEDMPESEVNQVYEMTVHVHSNNSPYKALSKADIMKDLTISREQYSEGKYMNAQHAADDIRTKYGL